MRPILIGLPGVLVAVETGITPLGAATYMTAPDGLRGATVAGRWLKAATERVAAMTATAARLPAILRARRRRLVSACGALRAVEHRGQCLGSAGLRVDADQHCATYTAGLFAAALRGRGLGREVTRLVLGWAFDVLGVHRVELEVLASNGRAIRCCLSCGFRREGVRREAGLYPGGWKDFILMAILRPEHAVPSGTGAGPQAKPRRPAKPTV
jgi:RimJ/RimL family protein N-acetyltransferase